MEGYYELLESKNLGKLKEMIAENPDVNQLRNLINSKYKHTILNIIFQSDINNDNLLIYDLLPNDLSLNDLSVQPSQDLSVQPSHDLSKQSSHDLSNHPSHDLSKQPAHDLSLLCSIQTQIMQVLPHTYKTEAVYYFIKLELEISDRLGITSESFEILENIAPIISTYEFIDLKTKYYIQLFKHFIKMEYFYSALKTLNRISQNSQLTIHHDFFKKINKLKKLKNEGDKFQYLLCDSEAQNKNLGNKENKLKDSGNKLKDSGNKLKDSDNKLKDSDNKLKDSDNKNSDNKENKLKDSDNKENKLEIKNSEIKENKLKDSDNKENKLEIKNSEIKENKLKDSDNKDNKLETSEIELKNVILKNELLNKNKIIILDKNENLYEIEIPEFDKKWEIYHPGLKLKFNENYDFIEFLIKNELCFKIENGEIECGEYQSRNFDIEKEIILEKLGDKIMNDEANKSLNDKTNKSLNDKINKSTKNKINKSIKNKNVVDNRKDKKEDPCKSENQLPKIQKRKDLFTRRYNLFKEYSKLEPEYREDEYFNVRLENWKRNFRSYEIQSTKIKSVYEESKNTIEILIEKLIQKLKTAEKQEKKNLATKKGNTNKKGGSWRTEPIKKDFNSDASSGRFHVSSNQRKY